ncbi:hypothetical protein [Halopolyspora algeriensis]|uniref:hypothetical protein n=1 Tax=Halopolyspora algeriensis TaxID=1500506 RepID=UPI00114FF6F9|nr:hypothetical protein [Halopolyspora algeriensis]
MSTPRVSPPWPWIPCGRTLPRWRCGRRTERATAVPALHAASDVLAGHTVPEIPGMRGDSSPETESLASALLENALHARTAIDAIFGPDEPWKSYTLSLVRTQHLRIR